MNKQTRRLVIATAVVAAALSWMTLQPGLHAAESCAEAAKLQAQTTEMATIIAENHGGIFELELLESPLVAVTAPPCPAEYECTAGLGDCRKILPPQCSTIDTGDPACSIGAGKIRCPIGQTIHITNCDCEEITPGQICLNEDQSWTCQ